MDWGGYRESGDQLQFGASFSKRMIKLSMYVCMYVFIFMIVLNFIFPG